MKTNKSLFKSFAFFTLMIAPLAFVQARTPRISSGEVYSATIFKNTNTESLVRNIETVESFRSFKRYDTLALQNALRKQKCDPSQSIAVGIGSLNLSYILWRDRRYMSVAFGASTPKISVSVTPGMCEPSTGFFINATLAMMVSADKVNSVTWYPGKAISFERTYSTPTIGVSAGVMFKF